MSQDPEQAQSDLLAARYLAYPYQVSGTGAPLTADADQHLRDLILQVLFTSPGERVNLPEFGVGVQRLLFEPSSPTLQASAQFLITTNLSRWLGDRIDATEVSVTSEPGMDETVTIDISYTVKATQQRLALKVQV
jgi:phage baseplate assembly protein W